MAGYRNTSGDEREYRGDADAARVCSVVDEAAGWLSSVTLTRSRQSTQVRPGEGENCVLDTGANASIITCQQYKED
jgi:hypothetical protein